ncbi:MAG: thiol-disulfide oxidoreductase DCC family protein [Verrucomicrobiota bacterium]
MPDTPLVVLIDADCALCCGTAAWLSARDPRDAMVFASNRGEVARIAGEPPGGDPGTVVVWDGSRRLVRSAAIARLLRALPAPWPFVACALRCVPRVLRDAAYDFVAARRGRSDRCASLSVGRLVG